LLATDGALLAALLSPFREFRVHVVLIYFGPDRGTVVRVTDPAKASVLFVRIIVLEESL